MSRTFSFFTLSSFLFFLLLLTTVLSEQVGDKVIYGEDDRLDYYAYVAEHGENDVFSRIARESIVALMSEGTLGNSQNGVYRPRASTLAERRNMCDGQRFNEQLTASWCSGTLVDETHVVTAGHCIKSQSDCDSVRFVFNYYVTGYDGGEPQYATIREGDVYSCSTYISVLDDSGGEDLDWALITLDRSVDPSTGHRPVSLQSERAAVSMGEQVVMIGFPSGLPLKIENNGRVVDTRSGVLDYFRANSDAFGGNSGSGVFNADGSKMVGILVRGQTDYVQQGDCTVVNEVSVNDGGEAINYAFHARPECESNADCSGEGSICNLGTCIIPECTTDAQCCAGQTCDSTTFTCGGNAETQWFRMTGDCGVQCDNCVSSGNFPAVHDDNEDCTIEVLQDSYIEPSMTWDLEVNYDHVLINGVDVEDRSAVPSSLSTGDTIRWTSDVSQTNGGWQLCFSNNESAGECTSDGDCESGEVCVNERCSVAPDCQSDSDCSTGETCQSGECVPGPITDEWFEMSGDCGVQDNCVSSGNWPQNHGDNERCTVRILQNNAYVIPSTVWELEIDYDHVYINRVDVESRSDVPAVLNSGDEIEWMSDSSVTNRGWQLCFSDTEPVPDCVNDQDCEAGFLCTESQLCEQGVNTMWFRMSGDCGVQGENCVSSGEWPEQYENREVCAITVLTSGYVSASQTWNLEDDFDHVLINGVDTENRNQVPAQLAAGSTIEWSSDVSVTHGGWQLCFSEDPGSDEPVDPSECEDGETDNSDPCVIRTCADGSWIEATVDCAEHFGVPCLVDWVPAEEGQCCSTCPCDEIVCAAVVCEDGSVPPIRDGNCCPSTDDCPDVPETTMPDTTTLPTMRPMCTPDDFNMLFTMIPAQCITLLLEATTGNPDDTTVTDEDCDCLLTVDEADAVNYDCRYTDTCDCTLLDLWQYCKHMEETCADVICEEDQGRTCAVEWTPKADYECCSTCRCDSEACPEVVCEDGTNPPPQPGQCCGDLSLCPGTTPTTGGEAYVMHDGPCAMYTPSEDECAADSTLVYSMSGTPEECAQECEERADCKQLTITMQDKETAWCWLLSSEYMAGEMDKWQYVQRPVTAEAGMTCCLSSASEHMKMSSCTENGCMITQEIGYFPGGSASIKLMANLANEGEMAAVYVNNKYAAMCTEASCGEYTECSTPSLEEMEKLTISVMSMPTASTCGDSALSVETTLMYGGDMSDDDDESESADTPDTDESESADTPDTDESDESTDTDESSESAEEDPCSCSGSMGWSSETESCQEGSTTSCDECPTMSGCDSSTCAEASCPMEYDAMRLCQCTANCAEYGNCCADASTCLEAESDSDESAEPMSCTTNSDCPNYKLYPSADGGWCDGGVCSTCDAEGFLECYTYDFPNGFDYNAMDSCVQACACDLEFLGSESKSPPVTTDGVPNGMVYKWADATRLPEECQGVCFGPGCYDKVSDSCCSSGEFGGAEVFADLSSTFANGETCVSVSFGSETVMLAGGCGTSGKFFYGEQCGGSTFGPFAGIGADSVCYQPDTDCRCNAYVETTEAGCYRVGSIPAMPGMPQELYFLDVVDPVCRDRGTPDNGGDGGDSGDDYEDCYEVWQLESRCNGDYEVYEDQTPASCLIEAATRGYTYFSHHSGNNKCRVWMTDNCDNPRGANAAWTTYRSIC